MAENRLLGRTAVVTGSSSGIGRAIALAFAAAGTALVICADITPEPSSFSSNTNDADKSGSRNINSGFQKQSDQDNTTPTHEIIMAQHGAGKAAYVCCDVTLESKIQSEDGGGCGNASPIRDAIAEAVRLTGKLDILVNNAALGIMGIPLHETSFEDWRKCFAVASDGSFLGTKHAVGQFLEQELDDTNHRGCVINISSIGGLTGFPSCSAYCAAKSSVIALSRVTATEYATRGIRCNAICPGYTATPMLSRLIEAEPELSELDSSVPVGYIGQPTDIANAAVWLANAKESGYITGVALPVDGGFLASGVPNRLRQDAL